MNLHEKRQIERERKIFVVAKVLVVIITFELYHGGLIDIEQNMKIPRLNFFIFNKCSKYSYLLPSHAKYSKEKCLNFTFSSILFRRKSQFS